MTSPHAESANRPRDLTSLLRAKAPSVTLVFLLTAYVALFTYMSLRRHYGFVGWDFDLAIFDQGVWLLSAFKDPYVTVRGLHLFADHSSFILVLVAPLYWLWDSPALLLITQTLALALATIPLYALTRDVLGSRWLGVGLALALLLHPAVGWTNLENFHPDSYEVLFLMTALYFMVKQRWYWFFLFLGLLLLVKEDVPLLTIPLGVYIAFRFNRRVGIITAVGSLLWLVLTLEVVMPLFHDGGTVYWGRIPFGGPVAFLKTAVTDPGRVLSYLWTQSRLLYIYQHLSALAFLPLLSPLALAAVGPLALNLVSTHTYMHQIEYHYSTLIVPTLMVAAVLGIELLGSARNRTLAVGMLLVTTLGSAAVFGPIQRVTDPGYLPDMNSPRHAALREAIDLLPQRAVVSAHYSIVPHIAHREEVYCWPNPFRAENWADGTHEGERLPMSEDVEYLLLIEATKMGEEQLSIYHELRSHFRVIFAEAGVELLERRDAITETNRSADSSESP